MHSPQFNNNQINAIEEKTPIDIKYLYYIIMKRWWIIVACSVICASLSALVNYYFTVPEYSASSTMYVYKKVANDSAILNELNAGSQLVNDSIILIKSKAVLNRAISAAGANISAEALSSKIDVSAEKDTRVIKISIIYGDPEMAANLTNAVSEAFLEVFKNLTHPDTYYLSHSEEYINIVDRALPNHSPNTQNKQRNNLAAVILGIAIGFCIIFLIEFLDDTIKSSEQIKICYNLEVLGVVPMFENKNNRWSI